MSSFISMLIPYTYLIWNESDFLAIHRVHIPVPRLCKSFPQYVRSGARLKPLTLHLGEGGSVTCTQCADHKVRYLSYALRFLGPMITRTVTVHYLLLPASGLLYHSPNFVSNYSLKPFSFTKFQHFQISNLVAQAILLQIFVVDACTSYAHNLQPRIDISPNDTSQRYYTAMLNFRLFVLPFISLIYHITAPYSIFPTHVQPRPPSLL